MAMATMILAASATSAFSTDTNNLPMKLPIGSEQECWEWAVTNRPCMVNFQMYFTNHSGFMIAPFILSGTKEFHSYQAFHTCMVSNELHMFNSYRQQMDDSKTVRFVVIVYYYMNNTGEFYNCLIMRTNLGFPPLINSNSIAGIVPTNVWVILDVPNLQRFSVETDTYTYTWPSQGLEPTIGYPPELTTNNLVVINQVHALNTSRIRLTIGTGSHTNRYTQFGDMLTAPSLNLGDTSITVTVSRGADTTVEATTNLTDWVFVSTNSDLAGAGIMTLPVAKDLPRRFYRAWSQ